MKSGKKVGIIGHGNDQWVAGILYLKSLIVGRYLLSENNRETALFIHKEYHNNQDYVELEGFLEGIDQFDYFYGSSFPWLKNSIHATKRLLQNRFPLVPHNNLPGLLAGRKIEVIFPANALLSKKYSSAKLIGWIPDFQDVHLPQYFTWTDRIRRRIGFWKMALIADKIILGNQLSYEDACRLFPAMSHKFEALPFTLYLGNNWRLGDPDTIGRKYNLPEEYLMFPSQFWKHKNHRNLFEAVLILKNKGLTVTLVCTGLLHDSRFPDHCSELLEFIKSNGLTEHIHILGLLPRTDQIQLMRKAKAIVQPSFFEGWSALLEDCRGLGKTVFVSDTEVHREQKPDYALFFDPHSPIALANLIEQHWDNLPPGISNEREELGERLNRDGLKDFAQRFSIICNSIQ